MTTEDPAEKSGNDHSQQEIPPELRARLKTLEQRWNWKIWRKRVLLLCVVFCLGFAGFTFWQYQDLVRAFSKPPEFIPTKIYSDVTRVVRGESRSIVLGRLKDLGYEWQATQDSVRIQLRNIDYPHYLIPDAHPTLEWAGKPVEFLFDGTDPSADLISIRPSDDPSRELDDLYLEPELVATLSRGSQSIRKWIAFKDIPALVWKSIIAVEDQHFLEHSGFDPRGMARAIWINLKTLSLAQGGSTITQQLVKNLLARRSKNIFKKLSELILAVILEAQFEKEKILERYLNEVYLGQIGSLEIHGVSEGARYFFDKDLTQLNTAEIALIAGIIRGPHYYSPYRHLERAKERQFWVLQKMAETGHIAQGESEDAKKLPIRLSKPTTAENKAPYFNDYVKAELLRLLKGRLSEEEIFSQGFRVYTTLDVRLNRIAQKAVEEGVGDVEKRFGILPSEDNKNSLEGALASVDHATGYIRALVGGKNYLKSTFNRILNMKRQVGSTFKPLVYLTAFAHAVDTENTPIGPGYPMEDQPWKLIYDGGKQTWSPENYDQTYSGWISLRTALIHSINTVGARLGILVGIPRIIETARALGIESELPNVPSLSLGVAELSPIELLKAYSTLANSGVRDDLTVIRAITENDGGNYARFVFHPKAMLDAAPIELLNHVLQEILIHGTAKAAKQMGFERPAAGKTGTTSDYRDSWFAGFTPQLTTVVWVGVNEGTLAQAKLTGAGTALPIWVRYMNEALESAPPAPFPTSDHLTEVRIDKNTGKRGMSGCPEDQILTEKYIQSRIPDSASCAPSPPPSAPVLRMGE